MTPEQRERVGKLTRIKRHPWSFGRSFLANLLRNAQDRELTETEAAKLNDMWAKEGKKCRR